jgi:hypothetical protein
MEILIDRGNLFPVFKVDFENCSHAYVVRQGILDCLRLDGFSEEAIEAIMNGEQEEKAEEVPALEEKKDKDTSADVRSPMGYK